MRHRFAAKCEATGMRISISKSEVMALYQKKVAGPLHRLRDGRKSSVTQEAFRAELLLLHIQESQLRWLGYLYRMPR